MNIVLMMRLLPPFSPRFSAKPPAILLSCILDGPLPVSLFLRRGPEDRPTAFLLWVHPCSCLMETTAGNRVSLFF